MKTTIWGLLGVGACVFAHAQTVDWQKVDDTLGRKPAVTDEVHRYGLSLIHI